MRFFKCPPRHGVFVSPSRAKAEGAAGADGAGGGGGAGHAAELPPLPGKGIKMVQNQRDPAFIAMRKHGLESYLRQVAALTQALRDESGVHDAAFEALLEFLELGR